MMIILDVLRIMKIAITLHPVNSDGKSVFMIKGCLYLEADRQLKFLGHIIWKAGM